MWQQTFNDNELVDLIDLEYEYKNVLTNLGTNTKAKARAERLLKLINSKKLAWYKIDEPLLHDVLGIERCQRRRMKLIMAKLQSRLEKRTSTKPKH